MKNDIHLLRKDSIEVWCFEISPDIDTTTSYDKCTCSACQDEFIHHANMTSKYDSLADKIENYMYRKLHPEEEQRKDN